MASSAYPPGSLAARESTRKDAKMIAGSTAIVILLLLAAVHVYWAAGGKTGKAASVPTQSDHRRA